ncbi:hypothetical protein [Streptomyces pactum]|uniref:Uncharacterized protein n=1 Tax=Streptomyces pactum TaxID=68249 RepID=A0A1S6JD05_9ACTN|nr:hypothetical protein [Streptomyces pactum]AQS69654.1 hypothetical protein B1H29_24655 [Streptomyces pactum]
MGHPAWKAEAIRKAAEHPVGPGSVGIRAMAHKSGFQHIDPSDYGCPRLAAQLADEWLEYVAATQITGWAPAYRRAIHRFCKDMTTAFGADARGLTLASPELVDALIRWERSLPEGYKTGSKSPGYLASSLRTLIIRRDDHADRTVDPVLVRIARGPMLISWGESNERDEFTRADKQAMLRAAWNCIRALETRLTAGWALASQGQDPRQGSWTNVPDLLWGLSQGQVEPADIRAALPTPSQWPEDLRALVAGTDGIVTSRTATSQLARRLVAQLYPTTLDLHPFRVLLMDTTGHAAEEVTGFGEDDVEFLPKGVRLTLLKNRAERLRHRAFRDAAATASEDEEGEKVFTDRPRRETSTVVRRLLDVTARVRARAPQLTGSLFVRAVVRPDDVLAFDYWNFSVPNATFVAWLDSVGVKVTGEPHIGRMRKSTKVEKAIATGGRISAAADDHLEETFKGHYAQGTTLRILSGEVITTAQDHWFGKAVDQPQGPTVVSPDAAGLATDSDRLHQLGLDGDTASDIVQGQLDMGLSHCVNPWESPFSRPGELCAVAPLRCLECRNAWIMPSQLPQLLLFQDHLERMRRRLTPLVFTRLWGQSYVNLRAVLADRSDEDKAIARKHIEAGEASLDLPLVAHAEFDS